VGADAGHVHVATYPRTERNRRIAAMIVASVFTARGAFEDRSKWWCRYQAAHRSEAQVVLPGGAGLGRAALSLAAQAKDVVHALANGRPFVAGGELRGARRVLKFMNRKCKPRSAQGAPSLEDMTVDVPDHVVDNWHIRAEECARLQDS